MAFQLIRARQPVGKRCILNVAIGSWFPKGQSRIRESASSNDGTSDLALWRDDYPNGSPSHQESPYAFKTASLKWARSTGYESALWLDASMIVKKPMESLWRHIENVGHLFVMDGTSVAAWISDRALARLGKTRDDMCPVPLIFAGCIGLNFKVKEANEFLDRWAAGIVDKEINYPGKRENVNGLHSADPRCAGHCGEQSLASIIRYEMGLESTPYGKYMALNNDAIANGSTISGAGM